MLPPIAQDELRELGEDIKRRGLQSPISIFTGEDGVERLLDGINRLDAMEMVGIDIVKDGDINRDIVPAENIAGNVDPYAYVLSANLLRPHLTTEQKRNVIAELLKANPEKSNRQIAKMVGVDHKTATKVRREKEATGEIPQLKTTKGKDGKLRPARKQKVAKPANPDLTPEVDEEEAPIEAPAPKTEAATLDSHLSVAWDWLQDESNWPDLNAGRKARRAKAMKKFRAIWLELVELVKPAPRRGRPAKVEHTGAEA